MRRIDTTYFLHGLVRTHTPLAPLSDGRGFPAGFELVNGEDHGDIWMGDHSHTWLASDEILDAPDQSLTHSGIVTLKQFKNWDGVSEPESYSGGIWGPNVVTSSPDQITEATTHVQISWSAALLAEVKYFTDEVKRLVAEHGPIRFVFGFDS
jgi:hypothetical protein